MSHVFVRCSNIWVKAKYMRQLLSIFVLCFVLCLGALLFLTSCGQPQPGQLGGYNGIPSPQPTNQGPLSGPVPPTLTAVLPPDYVTPTPIPPERQRFFIGMGNGGLGVPAIQADKSITDTSAPAVTEEQVRQYVETNLMKGAHVTVDYAISEATITSIELTKLEDVYRRYMPESLIPPNSPNDPYPPETPVYIVELRGKFHFAGGPAPGNLGDYEKGVWVFHAHTGDDLMEGGVSRIDTPVPWPTP